MRKSFQYRIYPTKKQESILNRTLSTCRHLYNDSLAERKRQAELNRLKQNFDVFPWGKTEWINYYTQANKLPLSKCDIDIPIINVDIKTKTGIDVGLSSLITLSNGEQIDTPRYLRASEKRLAKGTDTPIKEKTLVK